MNSILIILGLMALGTIAYLVKANKDLKREVSDKTFNIKSLEYGVKSYRDELGQTHNVIIQQNKTIADIKNSKDSTTVALKEQLKLAKIKLKHVTQVGDVTTKIKTDTTVQFVHRDTTYDLSNRPHLVELIKISGDTLTRTLEINNKQSLIWHTKKETINPPKRFFLARWLQKRHNVTYVDIVNTNPLIKTINQKFTIIIK